MTTAKWPPMQNLKKKLKAYIKKLLSDLHSAIVSIAVAALFLAVGGMYIFAKNVWDALAKILQSPTPIWATMFLVLAVLAYIYLKSQKRYPYKPNNPKIKYFTIGKYKWEVKIYDSGSFSVEKYPYCVDHDLKFIFGNRGKYCPGTEREKCNNQISEHDEFKIYESAKSIIERKVRNNEY